MTTTSSDVKNKLGALLQSRPELARLLLERHGARAAPIPFFPRGGREAARLPASWAQQRLWFIDRLEGGAAGYQIPLVVRLRGILDQNALQKALDALIQRHETLRTVFAVEDGLLRQEVRTEGRFPLPIVELGDRSDEERDKLLRMHAAEEVHARFDLETGPLVRGRLLRLRPEEHVLLVTMHHIVGDGWSMGVFFRELAALYSAFHEGGSNPLPPLAIQYADYARWQQEFLRGEELDRQLAYWRESLRDAPPEISLSADHPRPVVQTYRGGSLRLVLDAGLSARLKGLARWQDVTLFMVLQTGWAILLARLSGQDDVVIGTPMANRQRQEVEGLVGFFANTLPLRVRVAHDYRLDRLFGEVRETVLGAFAHQDAPFEKIVEALQPQRSLARNPIFQVMFALQNAPRSELRLPGLTAEIDDGVEEPAVFDLFLSLEERGEEIVGSVNYATDLFERATVERWMKCFKTLLGGMTDAPQCRIGDLPICPEDERGEVVQAFNATRVAYPWDRALHELFEEQARRTPDAVAVEHEGAVLTYGELNRQGNQLARYLASRGVGPDQVVGICMGRSPDMIVGLLGILKAGGAYLPLDPNYPSERLQQMLEDAAPEVVLSETELLGVLPASQAKVITLDEKLGQIAGFIDEDLRPAKRGLSSENLVYVIYTSGSTGRPKGTAMRHRSMVNLIEWHRRKFGEGKGRRVLQFAALSFDVAFQEIFSTLCTGGTLVLLDEWVRRDAKALTDFLIKDSIERLFVPPLMLQSIAEHCRSVNQVPERLKDVITAGEQLRVSGEIRELFRRLKCCRLHNHYGPTETHVATALTLEGDPGKWLELPPIGRPISNTQIYVLDAQMQPVPIGVPGEVYIGGANVARGYLKRPELTEQRFVADPYSADPDARLYKTGDLGRWRANGVLEYLARNDDQVKIRGFRVELGEIEVQLARCEQVKEAVVVVREDAPGEKRLVAYLVPRGECSRSIDELRKRLKAVLPEYMVPSAFVALGKLPLSPSGKLDRRSLPAPDMSSYASREYEPPRGEVEEILAGIWRDLLQVERVGRNDNFFELGGHSLLIVQMLERMRRIGLSAEVRRVFESQTLADLASSVAPGATEEIAVPPNLIPSGCQSITPEMLPLVELESEHIERIVQSVPGGAGNIQDIYPLAPLQEGMLFHYLAREQEDDDAYVLVISLRLSSNRQLERLINALQNLIDRNDILRTAVLWEGLPLPVQVVYRRAALRIERLELRQDMAVENGSKPWSDRRRLDIHAAPLLRLVVASEPKVESSYALLQIHHMVCDNRSLDSMLAELVALFNGRSESLPEPTPYRRHVAETIAYGRMRDGKSFFRDKLLGIEEPSAPFGLVDVHGSGSQVEQARHMIDHSMARRVLRISRSMGVTAATLFHAAWGLVVARASARDDVVYGTVLLGRMHGNVGTERALGLFINTLPIRLDVRNIDVKSLIYLVQRELIGLLEHEHLSLAVAQRCSSISGSTPLFSSLLNYRHGVEKLELTFAAMDGIALLETYSRTNYPIMLSVDEVDGGFEITVDADRRIGARRIAGYVCTAMQSLLEALDRSPQVPALALEVLPEEERRLIVRSFNSSEAQIDKSRLIHELFEEQARRMPDAVAVEHEGALLTYGELDRQANQLAQYLASRGVGPDQVVGICMGRTPDMIVGLLGILKAGGAYLPIDPNHPPQRLRQMLEDAAPGIVLTESGLSGALPPMQAQVIVLDEQLRHIRGVADEDIPASKLSLSSESLVYVIYTSGSTGRPKGTAMRHRSMVNLIEWHRRTFGPSQEGQRVLQFAALGFDVAFQEVFSTLCTGGTLVLLDEWVRRDVRALSALLQRSSIHRLFLPPLMLQSVAEYGKAAGERPASLKDVITAGEQLRVSPEIREFFRQLPGIRLHNHYGPTETHVVTALTLEGDPEAWPDLPPIGRPIANTRIYVLDGQMQPVPVGVTGEIYIGGANVARGYLHRPELTEQRFLADPYGSDPEAKLYKTGDLGRWRADGTLDYLGRNDDQVKIRGFRIELGEIETQLARHRQVKEVAVVAREDVPGEKRLVAYFTPRGNASPGIEELRTHLKAALPEHMVPSAFVALERLPLTSSGKLDRRSLPAPDLSSYASQEYEPPRGEVEKVLAEIWRELLQVERVGRNDNFFELGGHSLLVIRLIARVQQALGVRLALPAVLKHPVVEELAVVVNSSSLQPIAATLGAHEPPEMEEGFI